MKRKFVISLCIVIFVILAVVLGLLIRSTFIAKSFVSQADTVFSDITHTYEENQKEYGLLSRYSVASDQEACTETHSINLKFAFFTISKGTIWIDYTQEAFDADGNVVYGSKDISSVWNLEKDENGNWVVTNIDEHP